MKYIENWQTKKLKCIICGDTKSVKYLNNNNLPMCNECILLNDNKNEGDIIRDDDVAG